MRAVVGQELQRHVRKIARGVGHMPAHHVRRLCVRIAAVSSQSGIEHGRDRVTSPRALTTAHGSQLRFRRFLFVSFFMPLHPPFLTACNALRPNEMARD